MSLGFWKSRRLSNLSWFNPPFLTGDQNCRQNKIAAGQRCVRGPPLPWPRLMILLSTRSSSPKSASRTRSRSGFFFSFGEGGGGVHADTHQGWGYTPPGLEIHPMDGVWGGSGGHTQPSPPLLPREGVPTLQSCPVQVPADPGTDVPHRGADLRRGVRVPAHGGTPRYDLVGDGRGETSTHPRAVGNMGNSVGHDP